MTRKKIVPAGLFLFIAVSILWLSVGCTRPSQAQFDIIPAPKEVILQQGEHFILDRNTVIYCHDNDSAMQRNAMFLSSYIKQMTGLDIPCVAQLPCNNVIRLSKSAMSENNEGYRLTVSQDSIVINGASDAGTFYGIQTLRKALPIAKGSISIPAVMINDAPRFAYRGAHLDVARHFLSPDSVKRYIDILALHNINRFHWHLSDDQGWRIEIKKYPKLTEVGSYRPETVVGHNTEAYDGIPHQGFYTQEEIRQVVAYAAERYITIIPEIDLPGHMQAALAAYPHLGCTGGPYEVWKMWGVSENVLCVGNDETIQFIKDVLTEVADLFPSHYIHVGGDECPKVRWKECAKCQARIVREGLQADGKHTAEERLQSYVIKIAEQHLQSMNRSMIGWDETLEGGLASNATVMSWRGEYGGIVAARQHHDVIMTPNTYLYFDYYQTKDRENEPMAIGGYIPLEAVYHYEPIPAALTPDEAKHIVGVQANLWTEYITHFGQIEYMILPRMAALCEVQWSAPEKKNYDDFTRRLMRMMSLYDSMGYNYAKHLFNIKSHYVVDTLDHTIKVTLETVDSANEYYSLDGSDPVDNGVRYRGEITIDQNSTLKAVALRNGEAGSLLCENFIFNKATASAIKMLTPINKQYEYGGAMTLVDGLIASDTNYKTGRWIAFYTNDMEAIIDLGCEQEISMVGFNTCVEKGAWIFDARGVTIATSCDGEQYNTVSEVQIPAMTNEQPNGIYNHKYEFCPVNARYVRVKILGEQEIPAWHGGKGHPAFLFIDELIVN